MFIWSNNAVLMFRVTPDTGPQLAGFIDISRFNLAHWRGNEEEADETESGESEARPVPN